MPRTIVSEILYLFPVVELIVTTPTRDPPQAAEWSPKADG